MNKRKIMLMALSLCMVAILAIGGTLAYLTDTDQKTNTFTVGDVDIELIEQQRKEENGAKTTELEPFKNDKVLLPIVGSAQGEEDAIGMPIAANYVDKIVDVKNTGDFGAWVRVLFAFPADMDDAASAANMMLHWNHDPEGYNWKSTDTGVHFTHTDGRVYNIYNYTYKSILAKDATTNSHAIIGVYLDKRVDATTNENGDVTYTMTDGNGVVKTATYPTGAGNGPQIMVFAQAVQADGFATADAAFDAADLPINPWAN